MYPDFHPASFYQVNDDIEGALYADVLSECEGGNVIDAYCGAGNLTLMIASKAKQVYGIEICKQAVDEAIERANNRKIFNAEFICGDCKTKFPALAKKEMSDVTVVFDPPRKGVDESTLAAAIELAPQKIVYVSCNPATLARDLKTLLPAYSIQKINIYDMFPQTIHVETLVVLSKKTISHIDVELEFGEGEGQISLQKIKERADAKKPKEKVTYKMIQEYIKENYGFKVHTAYIAEVKRELGLPMYDAPNAVEELKKPRQHPTERMGKAIKETLEYFDIAK